MKLSTDSISLVNILNIIMKGSKLVMKN